jgi:sec-independent protein translocase protein TatB
MFGLGMGEIVVILIVALLFVGPDKLPGAAKSIGKGIRDLRRNTRDLRDTLEKDSQLGDAVRELRSALHDDPRHFPPPPKPAPPPSDKPPDPSDNDGQPA